MLPKSRTAKTGSILAVFLLILSTASAAEIQGDSTVWLNGENTEEFFVDTGDSETVTGVTVRANGNEIIDLGADKNITTEELSQLEYSGYTLKVETDSENSPFTESFQVRGLEVKEGVQDGSGFVGQKMGMVDGTDPISFTLEAKNTDLEDFSASSFEESFSVEEPEAEIKSSSDVEVVRDGDELSVKVYPYIDEPFSNRMTLRYGYQGGEFSLGFNPKIYELRAVPSNDRPPIELDYGKINEFAYNLNIYENGQKVSNTDVKLYDENFELQIEGISEDATFDKDDEDDVSFLEVQAVDNENAEYRLTLEQVPQLDAGQYRFTTKLNYKDEKTLIDSIRVNNALRLSGRVQDSQASPVQAMLNLQRGSTEIPIRTDSSGTYYKEIGSGNKMEGYNVNMRFFDTTSFSGSSNAEITANSVDFRGGESSNLAGDSESIKFEYWMDPPVERSAINAVNMMAVKFAYPMAESGHTADMQYNPANVNPDDLKVYSCSYWNFEGRSCLGEWSQVDEISIDHQGSRVRFNIDEPYLAENTDSGNKHILMNAFIVGTSAELLLNNGISVTGTDSGRVETNGDVTVSGRIVSENGEFVESADVEVSFMEGEVEVASLDEVSTGPEGRFSATGSAPSEPGNYSIRLEAEARNYDGIDTEFDDRLEVFLDEGISVEMDSSTEVALGSEEKKLIDVRNTGQTEMRNVELSFSGLNSDFYSVSDRVVGTIGAGETSTVEVTFNIPESYGVENYPDFQVEATGQNEDGEQFSSEESMLVQLTYGSTQEQTSTSESETADDSSSSDTSFSTDEVANMTGEFLDSQSSLNIALGLILVFLMALVGAMKKKQDENNGRRDDGRRPAVQKPKVQQQEDEAEQEAEDNDVDSQIDEIAGAFEEEDSDDSSEEEVEEPEEVEEESGEEAEEEAEEDETVKCDVCGEKFDSESGMELHKSVMH